MGSLKVNRDFIEILHGVMLTNTLALSHHSLIHPSASKTLLIHSENKVENDALMDLLLETKISVTGL